MIYTKQAKILQENLIDVVKFKKEDLNDAKKVKEICKKISDDRNSLKFRTVLANNLCRVVVAALMSPLIFISPYIWNYCWGFFSQFIIMYEQQAFGVKFNAQLSKYKNKLLDDNTSSEEKKLLKEKIKQMEQLLPILQRANMDEVKSNKKLKTIIIKIL